MPDEAVAVGTDLTNSETEQSLRQRTDQPVAWVLRNIWLWPSVFMAGIGLWRIGRPEMWQDELVTIDVAGRSTRQILSVLQHVDAVHGAYYLFMHGWIRVFGNSPISVRTPSALAMVGATACVVLVGERLFDASAGLLGGLVFAVIPAVTRFGQEARSYAFVVLLAALASLLLLRAIERPTVLRWAGYASCLTAIAYLNVVALSLVVGHGVGLLVRPEWRVNRRLLRRFGLAVLVAGLVALPVIFFGMGQASRQLVWVPHEAPWLVWPKVFSSAGVAWGVTALAALSWVHHRRPAALAAVLALVPLAVTWLASLGHVSYFFSKYLLFAIPGWAVLAGAGLAALRWKAASAAGLGLLVVLAIPGQLAMRGDLSHSWYNYPDSRPRAPVAYSEAAKIIAGHYVVGDGVVYLRGAHWWLMSDTGIPYYLPKDVKMRDVFLRHPGSEIGDLYDDECLPARPCMGTERRLWVVVPYEVEDALAPFHPDQASAVRDQYTQVWVVHPSGMTIALMQRNN